MQSGAAKDVYKRQGQKRLARTRRTHHSHNLARMHRNAQVVNDLDRSFPRPKKTPVGRIVHGKRNPEVFHLEQMMPADMLRSRRVAMVMMQLGRSMVGLLVRKCAFVALLCHSYSCDVWGSTSVRKLDPAMSNSSTTATSAKPGNTASHHMPAER